MATPDSIPTSSSMVARSYASSLNPFIGSAGSSETLLQVRDGLSLLQEITLEEQSINLSVSATSGFYIYVEMMRMALQYETSLEKQAHPQHENAGGVA